MPLIVLPYRETKAACTWTWLIGTAMPTSSRSLTPYVANTLTVLLVRRKSSDSSKKTPSGHRYRQIVWQARIANELPRAQALGVEVIECHM